MKKYYISGLFFLIFSFLFITGCGFYPLPVITYPDIYDPEEGLFPFYSNDPNKPFKYGMAYTYEECFSEVKKFKDDNEIKNGDVIADVGAANGYLDGALSVCCDSVTFYVEDVNPELLSETEFDKVVNYYSKIRGREQTNKFYRCVGNFGKTKLPDGIFDKVITNITFHEFTLPDDMIEDISKKLKQGGKLYINDAFTKKHVLYYIEGCNDIAYSVEKTIELMNKHGFYLVKMKYPENCYRNTLVFQKDKNLSENYSRKNNVVENLIEMLDNKSVLSDSLKTKSIVDSISYNIKKDTTLKEECETWINLIGYRFKKEKDYESAINVLNINVKLFPESPDTYYYLGEVYTANLNYDAALANYTKSVELKPKRNAGKSKIKKLKNYK